MANKLLPSFEVHGFRAFEHLSLEKLGRINLIVGKNNVGKSSLLEALWVYANQGSPSVLRSLLEDRDESGPLYELRNMTDDDVENQLSSVRYLFHGRRKEPKSGIQNMELGPANSSSNRLLIKSILAESVVGEQGHRKLREVEQDDGIDRIPSLLIQFGEKGSHFITLEHLFPRNPRDWFPGPSQMEKPSVLLSANGLSITDIGKFWDNITLSPQENDVLNTLRIIEPDIERVNLIQRSSSSRERIPIVKVRSFDNPIPLKSLGEGMNRMFGIALALANAKNGMLLVDEIESGLHYTVHLEMWRFIFQAAKRLNVQVFATTHSWDCISAFQEAAQDNEDDGMLIRLENKKGKIIPTFFDEKELAIVAREQIEVR